MAFHLDEVSPEDMGMATPEQLDELSKYYLNNVDMLESMHNVLGFKIDDVKWIRKIDAKIMLQWMRGRPLEHSYTLEDIKKLNTIEENEGERYRKENGDKH